MLSAKVKSMLESSTSPVSGNVRPKHPFLLRSGVATLRIASENHSQVQFLPYRIHHRFQGPYAFGYTRVVMLGDPIESIFLTQISFDPLIHWMTVAGGYPREMYRSSTRPAPHRIYEETTRNGEPVYSDLKAPRRSWSACPVHHGSLSKCSAAFGMVYT